MHGVTAGTAILRASRSVGWARLCKTSGNQLRILQNQPANEERIVPGKLHYSSHWDEEVGKKEGENTARGLDSF